jgi:hypothetical protein
LVDTQNLKTINAQTLLSQQAGSWLDGYAQPFKRESAYGRFLDRYRRLAPAPKPAVFDLCSA